MEWDRKNDEEKKRQRIKLSQHTPQLGCAEFPFRVGVARVRRSFVSFLHQRAPEDDR